MQQSLTRDREESGGKGFNELLLVNILGKLRKDVRRSVEFLNEGSQGEGLDLTLTFWFVILMWKWK